MTFKTKITLKATTKIRLGTLMGGSTGIIGGISQQFEVIG